MNDCFTRPRTCWRRFDDEIPIGQHFCFHSVGFGPLWEIKGSPLTGKMIAARFIRPSVHHASLVRSFKTIGPCRVSEEVHEALARKLPVVALESTIVAHGMPYPQNVEAALEVEATVRRHGAVPATIAVINGVPTVGLTNDEIVDLAKSGSSVPKCSTRELPLVIARKQHGATTVAATARLATLCGIEVRPL